jgi:dTDP-4-dehydrorhamnose reductase
MRVLIVGASGLIGSHLLRACERRGWDVMGTYSEHAREGLVSMNMTDLSLVRRVLKRLQPEIIFLTAFNPNVDYCEQHPDETRKVNVEGNANVITEAGRVGAKIVYYSTDFVFDGEKGSPYTEGDTPAPLCEYGRQKLAVERAIQQSSERHLIIRTTIVFGWEERGKNFFCHLLHTLRKNEKMQVPLDQFGTPTLVEDLAEASCRLVEVGTSGIVHVVGPDYMSRYEFAQRIAHVFALPEDLITPVSTDQLKQAAPRPLRAGLTANRFISLTGMRMRGVEEALEYLRGIESRRGNS